MEKVIHNFRSREEMSNSNYCNSLESFYNKLSNDKHRDGDVAEVEELLDECLLLPSPQREEAFVAGIVDMIFSDTNKPSLKVA